MATSLGLVAVFVAWQVAYRKGLLPEDAAGTLAFSWATSAGMALWATFFIFSIGTSAAELVLSAADPGSAVSRLLPAAAAAVSLVVAALGLGEAVRGPRVVEVEVPVRGLPPALRGLRIAQLSDLHVGATVRRAQVERVVRLTLEAAPDLIAVTGDLADGDPARLARHVAPLSGLTAPLGVFYVPGNHEYYWDAPAWIAKARELGMTPLINENRVVGRDGAKLLVAGVPDEQGALFVPGHAPDHARAAASSEDAHARVLLAHRPDGVPAAAKAGFDLQLSGHTHGGQFFPASLFIGLFHRHSRGLSRHDRLRVYVNPGTGYWGPAQRFAVPAEITVLTLVEERA
ncbi:MAG: metallophosphoesterase [Elusimicrobia bacterium]|nr:metallophosphoesterase [Elusimicrobiota bacterium]